MVAVEVVVATATSPIKEEIDLRLQLEREAVPNPTTREERKELPRGIRREMTIREIELPRRISTPTPGSTSSNTVQDQHLNKLLSLSILRSLLLLTRLSD